MNKKLNILFLSGWYPNRVLPTLGNFVQKHAEAVALHSNVIALNACVDPNCKQTFEITESTINNVYTINVYYQKMEGNIPFFSQWKKMNHMKEAYMLGMEKVFQKMKTIDLVHHNITYPSGFIAKELKEKYGIPYIVTEHSTAYLPAKNLKLGFLEKMISKKILKSASCITPVSMDLQNAMQNLGFEGTYEVIGNVVDTKLFSPRSSGTNEKIKFLHISTLDDAHKNISGMLHTAAALAKQRSDFEFHFIGDGDTTPHIETAKQLGIYNTIAFFGGTKTTAEVAALMSGSDCFVLFSNYENLPVVIIEALACGIPVISSKVGGIHEHITKSMGTLVEAKDEKGLLQAMNAMIDDLKNNKYNSTILRSYAEEHFSYQKVSEKFHHLYQRVINNNV